MLANRCRALARQLPRDNFASNVVYANPPQNYVAVPSVVPYSPAQGYAGSAFYNYPQPYTAFAAFHPVSEPVTLDDYKEQPVEEQPPKDPSTNV